MDKQVQSDWREKMLSLATPPKIFNIMDSTAKQYISFCIDKESSRKIQSLTKAAPVVKTAFFLSSLGILVGKLCDCYQMGWWLSTKGERELLPAYTEIQSAESIRSCLVRSLHSVKQSIDAFAGLSDSEYQDLVHCIGLHRVLMAVRSFYTDFKGFDSEQIYHSQMCIDIDDQTVPMTIHLYLPDTLPSEQTELFPIMLGHIIDQMLQNLEKSVRSMTLVPEDEYNQWIEAGWNTKNITQSDIGGMFKTVCDQQRDKVAIQVSMDSDLFRNMRSQSMEMLFKQCCFIAEDILFIQAIPNKNSYLSDYDVAAFVKTPRNDCVVMNGSLLSLLKSLTGKENVISIQNLIAEKRLQPMIGFYDQSDCTLITEQLMLDLNSNLEEIRNFLLRLWQCHILKIFGFSLIPRKIHYKEETICCTDSFIEYKQSKRDVILFGDTPNNSTVGILYLASFLVRNGVSVYCNYNDNNWDADSLAEKVRSLLSSYQPRVFAVSMKWFPHIQRVLEILKIVKRENPSVVTVVGGDTASWFYRDLIDYPYIDYVIRGDGELPLLHICQGKTENLPNCVYKTDGKIVVNPITFIQNFQSEEGSYLSNLMEFLPTDINLYFGTLFVYTHKGCTNNCIYCGGKSEAQERIFAHKKALWRPASLVKNDIIQLLPFVSTFMFDLEERDDIIDYLKEIWEGIDLSNHFCVLFYTAVPSEDVVKYVSSRFAYVRWNIDISSLSENHRMLLAEKGLVKPQPTDQQIDLFFTNCERLPNVEVDINTITGLPEISGTDYQAGEDFLRHIKNNYASFVNIHWGRLHSQPGDAISANAAKYGMQSFASSFQDFLKYSKMNFNVQGRYPTLENYKYPYILYQDADENAALVEHFRVLESIMSQEKTPKLQDTLYSRITYSELYNYSSQLSAALLKDGVKKGSVIAVSMNDPILQAIAIFAVIKAGAVYLLLDCNDSAQNFTYKRTHVHCMLYDTLPVGYQETECDWNLSQFPWLETEPVLVPVQYGIDDPIYIIYTSGTAGNPKGVEISAGSLANYICWRKNKYGHTPDDKTLNLLPGFFDGYFSNFYGCLMTGGTLTIAGNNHRKDIGRVIRIMQEQAITNMSLVPALYREIIRQVDLNKLPALRDVVLGGEKADYDILQKSKNAHIRLINEYGPSECTIASTCNMDLASGAACDIGTPVDGVGIYILNEDQNILPPGFKGEIYISGAGVAKRYINASISDTMRFMPDPFKPEMKMYRTGDLGVRNCSGTFSFVGRADTQVKVSGYRIELEEIEASILALPYISQVTVIAKTSNHLVHIYAFYIADQPVEYVQFKEDLSRSLPQYMHPNYYIPLTNMPLTAAGKIDKDALWDIYIERMSNVTSEAGEISAFEKEIGMLWKEVLNIPSIDVNMNFFEAGGNSIQLIQLHEKLNHRYENRFTVTDLFSYPTIRLQAKHLEQS